MQPGGKFDKALLSNGFERFEFSLDKRKPGDIMCGKSATHTEIYAGNNKSYSWGAVHDGLDGRQGMPCRYFDKLTCQTTKEKCTYIHIWRYTGGQ